MNTVVTVEVMKNNVIDFSLKRNEKRKKQGNFYGLANVKKAIPFSKMSEQDRYETMMIMRNED